MLRVIGAILAVFFVVAGVVELFIYEFSWSAWVRLIVFITVASSFIIYAFRGR